MTVSEEPPGHWVWHSALAQATDYVAWEAEAGNTKHKDGQKAPVPPEFRSLQLPGHLVGDWQGRDTCVLSSPFLPACLGITPPRRQRCQNVCFVKEDVPVVMLESILTSPMFIL